MDSGGVGVLCNVAVLGFSFFSGVAHKPSVADRAEHGKVVAAVSECGGALCAQLVVVSDEVDDGFFPRSFGNEIDVVGIFGVSCCGVASVDVHCDSCFGTCILDEIGRLLIVFLTLCLKVEVPQVSTVVVSFLGTK